MKAITLCLLVLVSASCLLKTNANVDVHPDFQAAEVELDLWLAELEADGDYMDVEQFGFIVSCAKILKKCLSSVRGVNCILKEVVAVMNACTSYVDAIDACGVAVPKDVAAVVSSCKAMITICNNIIHLNSTLCSSDNSTTSKCMLQLFKACMQLTRKINTTLKQITKLPSDTSSCFVKATNEVKTACNNFLPNIDKCIDSM
ncbi:uncharacterized protein [Drosophila tropicalis]|uniref:uncharacterized protein n=1 Tax=Drosophila tropicalis TaxID=46794 RepID=UPI0035AB882B